MDAPSFYMRNMLHQYGKQLVTSRRLARYHQLLRAESPSEISPELRRKMLVERVSKELFENLLFTGDENPILNDVRRELLHAVGQDITFRYPPGQLDISITRESAQGPIELDIEEKSSILTKVWKIIFAKVDATML